MILAIDAGNTRIKWALHDGQGFVEAGNVVLRDIDQLRGHWTRLAPPATAIVANVAGDIVREGIRGAVKECWGIEPDFASGSPHQCGVRSHYRDPAQLGPDRWAALIATRALIAGDSLVVCAGTATTVDALTSGGDFLGGIIVPGFDLMIDSLAANAARLGPQRGEWALFPRSTPDAMTTGALLAACGAIDRMAGELAARGGADPVLVMTGGNAQKIADRMGRPARVVETLILDGLARIAMQMR